MGGKSIKLLKIMKALREFFFLIASPTFCGAIILKFMFTPSNRVDKLYNVVLCAMQFYVCNVCGKLWEIL